MIKTNSTILTITVYEIFFLNNSDHRYHLTNIFFRFPFTIIFHKLQHHPFQE